VGGVLKNNTPFFVIVKHPEKDWNGICKRLKCRRGDRLSTKGSKHDLVIDGFHVSSFCRHGAFAGSQAPAFEYKAMLKAHSGLVSPTQEYLITHPELNHRENLLVVFSEAQKSFLEKSNEEARAKFEAVLTLITQDDWEKSDREVFFRRICGWRKWNLIPHAAINGWGSHYFSEK